MSQQLITALQAGTERMMEQRKALRHVQVISRLWPDGLHFACHVWPRDIHDRPIGADDANAMRVTDPGFTSKQAIEASGTELVAWEALAEFDADKARAVVDRVCARAHELLDPLLANGPKRAAARAAS